ncbi:MAG: GNAT family N-acetyltransferase [Chloroflexi bacterium]|nr:GNAT family N-acetyltransferase [Chloroflexota bacterium]
MTTHAPSAEPACPGATTPDRPADQPDAALDPAALRVERRAFDDVPRATWDRLAAANSWATPFSSWAYQRAWWDAYGASAHDQTLIVVRAGGAPTEPVAIVPLMHRHEVEPGDEATASKIRHGDPGNLTPVPPTAKAIFFGASYHADYATILAAPADMPAVATALVDHLASPDAVDPGHPEPWDAVDLRRLRCGDPTADALARAFGVREMGERWTLNLEREDVCPVVTFPENVDFEGYLATLDKKSRHEIRRKIRRAEASGEVLLAPSADPLADLPDFIDLHQRRWGADGLFPPTPGGDASRVFMRRLFEENGPDGPVRLSFLTVGERRVAAGIHVATADTWMFYNAGIDPDARELSPGVLLAARYVQAALEAGMGRFDFLRGNEPYKYEWGSEDEPIQRLLVRRDADGSSA